MQITLAEALLRRKELQGKVDQLRQLDKKELYETKVARKQITENIDDILAQVAKISITEVTAAFDYYSRQLRLLDAIIQNTNWTTKIEVDDKAMQDFVRQEAAAQ